MSSQRFKIIENKTGFRPVYYLIDNITGQQIIETENRRTAENKKALLDEWHDLV
jgi:hypothetical protein